MDLVGVLDRASVASQGVTTVYECPAGKGAKVQFMYRGVAGSNSTIGVILAGMTLFVSAAQTAGHIQFSGRSKAFINAASAAVINGTSDDVIVAPFMREYMLQAGDQVKYVIGGADYGSFQMDVIGVEVDVA